MLFRILNIQHRFANKYTKERWHCEVEVAAMQLSLLCSVVNFADYEMKNSEKKCLAETYELSSLKILNIIFIFRVLGCYF